MLWLHFTVSLFMSYIFSDLETTLRQCKRYFVLVILTIQLCNHHMWTMHTFESKSSIAYQTNDADINVLVYRELEMHVIFALVLLMYHTSPQNSIFKSKSKLKQNWYHLKITVTCFVRLTKKTSIINKEHTDCYTR